MPFLYQTAKRSLLPSHDHPLYRHQLNGLYLQPASQKRHQEYLMKHLSLLTFFSSDHFNFIHRASGLRSDYGINGFQAMPAKGVQPGLNNAHVRASVDYLLEPAL